ncbi:MAG: hypothetical protein MRY49_02130 [Candidatus Pacebacteria bacterium]|nr:hypothetical protein [Candidatus Paceibacterota bacterium]
MSDNMEYKNIKVEDDKDSEVKISGEISADSLNSYRERAIKNISTDVEIKGFRKGKVPEDVLIKNVGEMSVLQEAAELALSDAYPKIILEHKIEPLGHPQVSITKLAPKEDLGFSITTAVMPKVTLPDYKTISKKISSEKEEVKIEDKEVEEAVTNIQNSIAQGKGEKELPEVSDEFVKKLGDFKNVEDFKKKLKENLMLEKERLAKDKKRNRIADAIIEKSKISIPKLLIDGELERMLSQFKADIEQSGLTYDKYLTEVKKTDEDIRKEWMPIAEKKAKLQLILNKIALEEKVKPEEDQVKKEMEHILSHHKDAPEERVRIFVETMLTNEKVFEFLEK